MLPVQFLDTVLDMPVVVLRQVLGSMVLTNVVPQLQSIEGRRHSFRAAEAVLHGPDHFTEIPQLLFVLVVDVPVVRVVQILRCRGGEDIRSPTVTSRSQCLPFCCRKAEMIVIMAGMDQKDSYAILMKTEEGFHRIFMSWWAHIAFHAQECVLFLWAPTGGGDSAENCGFDAVPAHQQGHQQPLSWCRGRFSWSFG